MLITLHINYQQPHLFDISYIIVFAVKLFLSYSYSTTVNVACIPGAAVGDGAEAKHDGKG